MRAWRFGGWDSGWSAKAVAVGFCVLGAALSTTGNLDHALMASAPSLPPVGTLSFEILDSATGRPIPGKLTFVGVNGSSDPRFTTTDIGHEEGGAVAAFSRVFSAVGVGAVRVPHGTYDVYVSRGPEWSLYVARAVRIGAQDARVKAPLSHVVTTPGWLSGDFHVHAAASPDSRVPMRHRVFEFLADGIDLIVSTDHNVVSDYAPEIADLQVGELLASATGDELTTAHWGHFGAFPLPHQLEEPGQGALLARGRTAAALFAQVRRTAPGALINVHHPRIDDTIGYFAISRFDSKSGRADKAGFSLDFDAIEILNGYQDPDRRSLGRVLEDWFALLERGHLVTATGNSDTHHLTYNLAGYPRNYVALADDRPVHFDAGELVRALKARRSFFTTGPFIDVDVTPGGGGMGDIVVVTGGRILINVKVRAAPWIDVTRLTVIVGGKTVKIVAIPASDTPVRFADKIEIPVDHDTFVIFRVDGERPMSPVIGDRTRFEVRPVAITNPIFVDVDGSAGWNPPALRRAAKPRQRSR